jgi:hypothetical protein
MNTYPTSRLGRMWTKLLTCELYYDLGGDR